MEGYTCAKTESFKCLDECAFGLHCEWLVPVDEDGNVLVRDDLIVGE